MLQKIFPLPLRPLPKAAFPENDRRLQEQLEEAVKRLQSSPLIETFNNFRKSTEGEMLLSSLFGNSPFLSQLLLKNLEWFALILIKNVEEAFAVLLEECEEKCKNCQKKEQLMEAIRLAKQKAALLIAIADITGYWQLEEVTGSLSRFADLMVKLTVHFLLRTAHAAGELEATDPETLVKHSGLIVLALGKMGANELNYSSDIDLIIFFDGERTPYTGQQTVQHFFIRLTKELVEILQERTKDGYVFRVDLRLRPDPASMPLAISVRAAETYYESVGQNWERAALIKARFVAGDEEAGHAFLSQLRPFIWRKYLDFEAVEDIRSIKRQIESKQLSAPDNLAGYNIKIGHGGIREIEFFVQTQQLIWGGKNPDLRRVPTCEALLALVRAGYVEEATAEELIRIYRYYRILEHRLQMIADQQTHSLPETEEGLYHIATFIGAENKEIFIKDLQHKFTTVKKYYSQLFNTSPSLGTDGGSLVFTGTDNDPETVRNIISLGFTDGAMVSERIRGWHHGRHRATRTKRARELITELTPAILQAFSKTSQPDQAFLKFDEFLSRLPAGVQLFALFNANQHLLDLVADIMGSYPYLSEHLSRKPALLDYVLSTDFLTPIAGIALLKQELEERVSMAGHYEEVLDLARRWTHEKQFKIGVQLIRAVISPTDARQALSHIAEVVLSVLAFKVQEEFSKKHGIIKGAEFAVVGAGKLGSRELTFNSDVDLILIYDTHTEEDMSDGEEPLSASAYYTRLSRRFISSFSVLTSEGTLYPVDMRLRPSGNDGPVCTSFKTMDHYFSSTAHIWEYMALTRARVIFAKENFAQKIQQLISSKLLTRWENEVLVSAVLGVREKITQAYGTDDPWRLKYVRGGIIDADFLAQFLQLKYAADFPDILDTNTVKVLEKCTYVGILAPAAAEILQRAVLFLLDIQSLLRISYDGKLTLTVKKTLVSALGVDSFEEVEKTLLEAEAKVLSSFHDFITLSKEHPL